MNIIIWWPLLHWHRIIGNTKIALLGKELLSMIQFLLQEGGSVITALANLVQVLLTYCRSQLSTLTGISR